MASVPATRTASAKAPPTTTNDTRNKELIRFCIHLLILYLVWLSSTMQDWQSLSSYVLFKCVRVCIGVSLWGQSQALDLGVRATLDGRNEHDRVRRFCVVSIGSRQADVFRFNISARYAGCRTRAPRKGFGVRTNSVGVRASVGSMEHAPGSQVRSEAN